MVGCFRPTLILATCRIKRRRGGQRWLEIEAKYEKATNERPARFVGVVADITTRKRIERKAQRLSQQLLTIQEEERRSIAQELHNSTVQHLVAASLVLSAVNKQRGRNLDQAIATTESSLQEAIKELRTFSYLMNPLALQQRGLCKTLAAYVGGFADRSGLLCKVRMDRKHAKYPPLVQRTILRIVQEGLANAYRHASASRVSIDVRRLGARVHVVVADNGQGITSALLPSQRPSRAGVGIRGIRMATRWCLGGLAVYPSLSGCFRYFLPRGLVSEAGGGQRRLGEPHASFRDVPRVVPEIAFDRFPCLIKA